MHATATCLQHAFDPVERCFPLCSRSNTFSEREQVESRPAAAQAAMAFCARHSRNVDFAIVDCASPLHRLDQWQKEILSCIRPEDWHDGPTGMEEYLENDDTCQHIAQFTLETRFGERWFRFWQDAPAGKLIVLKEPAPRYSPAMVHCVLTADPPSIRAAFTLLSGTDLGAETLHIPLMIGELRAAASRQALQHGLLETSRQQVALALPGFDRDPPDSFCLWWPCTEVNDAGLQNCLTHLQSLPSDEQAESGEEDASPSISGLASESSSSMDLAF